MSHPLTITSPIGQQKFILSREHRTSEIHLFGRKLTFGVKGGILPFLAGLPALMSSYKYHENKTWQKLAVVHLGALVAQPVSAALQLVSMTVSLMASSFFALLAMAMPTCKSLAYDFAVGAVVSFDFMFLHLAGAVYPPAYHLQSAGTWGEASV